MKTLQLVCAIMAGVVSLLLLIGTVFAVPVAGTTLSGNMTVDNGFTAYIDTGDALAQWGTGLNLGSGDNWQQAYPISAGLTNGNHYYLHVIASDWGYIAGFKGKFELSNAGFAFANGGQSIVTQVNDPNWWKVYKLQDDALEGLTLTKVVDFTWPIDAVGAGADWIWTNGGSDINTVRYFSTPITPVPEPISSTLFLLGAGALGLRAFRRRKSKA